MQLRKDAGWIWNSGGGGGLAGVRAAVRRAREYAEERGLPLTVERLAAELQMRPEELRAAAEGGPAGGVKDERALRVLRRAYGEAWRAWWSTPYPREAGPPCIKRI